MNSPTKKVASRTIRRRNRNVRDESHPSKRRLVGSSQLRPFCRPAGRTTGGEPWSLSVPCGCRLAVEGAGDGRAAQDQSACHERSTESQAVLLLSATTVRIRIPLPPLCPILPLTAVTAVGNEPLDHNAWLTNGMTIRANWRLTTDGGPAREAYDNDLDVSLVAVSAGSNRGKVCPSAPRRRARGGEVGHRVTAGRGQQPQARRQLRDFRQRKYMSRTWRRIRCRLVHVRPSPGRAPVLGRAKKDG